MGIDDFKDKASDALNSDKGENASDSALDKGGDKLSDATGGKYDDKIQQGSDQADKRIGSE